MIKGVRFRIYLKLLELIVESIKAAVISFRTMKIAYFSAFADF